MVQTKMFSWLPAIIYVLVVCCGCPFDLSAADAAAKQALLTQYELHARSPSDIYEHLPVLRQLTSECSSAVEIGVRSVVSTWAILQGLSESSSTDKFFLGIDISDPYQDKLQLARRLAEGNGINFQFWKRNDMLLDGQFPFVDLLFIDSLHTYCHLTYELEEFSGRVDKYIAMHDTSAPWGDCDDNEYRGDYSEYSPSIDRSKRGLWPAVVDFLERHPEWILFERRFNNHGFTILKRVSF